MELDVPVEHTQLYISIMSKTLDFLMDGPKAWIFLLDEWTDGL